MGGETGSGIENRIIHVIDPHVEIILRQANELKLRQEYEKAITIYDQVLELDPRNARGFHSKGNVFDILGRYEEAIVCYESALECDPLNAETWYNKGVTLTKMGSSQEGNECIHRGISIATGAE
ncbi:MAG: tetratricopeptide repeat protein [Methanospirillum sp.]|uniref:tetratricopeptide repeat protein n=1 Tax=Methanospirillum sp. TaxID=45200 RepID=UPI00236FD7FF|nr:tetratricopeptide repeat protein [Methanospirillum sp.]MDD1727683.1 tetratricopeptide repeat protein [Methanospirillum sp.]